jgi:hypothetical protein
MKVSDWHILPILETSLQFFSSSSGSVRGKKILKTSCLGIGSGLLTKTALGNNKQKQKITNTWTEL